MPVLQKWVGTSWKMNKTLAEAEVFAQGLLRAEADRDPSIQRFVIPPFTTARQVKALLSDASVLVGAQNLHWQDHGAWTGEVSAPMLVDCGLDLVEIGHSERRAHFGETDETVGLKVEAAVRHGLIPLICVGETMAERDAGQAQKRLEMQVRRALACLSASQKGHRILFAYEPVWAIGEGGQPASPDYAEARQAEIIAVASDILGHRTPCLYGGSVNAGNCAALIRRSNIDGLFIGRSAWNVAGYLDILRRCSGALRQGEDRP
ncbi:MAG: triose-phosphate isomerase [Pseudomonadota bacterium]